MLALFLWGGLAAILFYFYAIKPMRYWKRRGVVQEDNPIWLFGDSLGVTLRRDSFYDLVSKVYSRFKRERYSGMYQFSTPALVINDPELIKQLSVKEFDHFVDHRTFIPEESDPLFGKNLFSLKGQKWREMRPILSPSFTSSKMRIIFILMQECVKNFVKYFKDKNEDVLDIEIKSAVTRLANDVIASAAFGLQVDSLANPNNEFYVMGKKASDFTGIITNLKFAFFFLFPNIAKQLKIRLLDTDAAKFFYNLIDEAIKTREKNNIVRPDMINLLLEARKGKFQQSEDTEIDTGFATVQEFDSKQNSSFKIEGISTMDIAAQALIFFLGGFDTITTAMSFLSYELAINTDVQEKLREEIREVEESCNGKLTYDALMKMKYLDMVVSEGLRKWPNLPAMDRVCTKPFTIEPTKPTEQPIHLNKGDLIWFPAFGIHRDPKYYPEPEKFIPERFNEENRAKIDPYTYFPFGLGPRNCIGSRFALMEIKTLFYNLLLNFEIVPTKKTQIPPKLQPGFAVTFAGGFNLGLKRIKN